LYELKKRTSELERFAEYSQAVSAQHRQHYRPAAERTCRFLHRLLGPDVALVPSTGASADLRLAVRNEGETAMFSAKARIVNVRNDPNPIKTGVFSLKWINAEAVSVSIKHGDSENLLVARLSLDQLNRLGEVQICELVDGKAEIYERARWNITPDGAVPEFDLEISLRADNKRKPLDGVCTVKPIAFAGPLKLLFNAED